MLLLAASVKVYITILILIKLKYPTLLILWNKELYHDSFCFCFWTNGRKWRFYNNWINRFLRADWLIFIINLTNKFHVAVRLFSNDKNIFQNSKPLLTMTHDRNCCRDFLQFKHNQVVKNSFCLRFFIFLLCKQLLLKFFEAFTCLIQNNLTNIFNWANQRKRVSLDVIHVSVL